MLSETVLMGFFFFALGAIMGSFLNVLILRYNTGRSASGRSACMSCGRTLTWYDLIPVISFFLLRGRCRTCTSRLSWQYPLVEGGLGLLYLLIFLKDLPIIVTVYACLVATLFLFIVVYDLKHLIIPEGPMYALIVLSAIVLFVNPVTLATQLPLWQDALMGPALFLFFTILFVITKGRGVGFGDAKLSLAIGFLLGFPEAVSALTLAFWIGASAGLFLLAWSHIAKYLRTKRVFYPVRKIVKAVLWRNTLFKFCLGKDSCANLSNGVYFPYVSGSLWHSKSEIPFAPFLALGTFLVFFFDISVIFF